MENANELLGLTKVVLYKHGVGYFERRGKVCGPCKIDLVCDAEAIDDMLKSLLALTSAGRVDSVTYESSKTLESRLAEFGFDIRKVKGLSELITQIRGIPVTLTVSGETLSGRVLGTDRSQQLLSDSRTLVDEQLLLYTADSKLKRIDISSISSMKVDDASMAEELKQQLELLFQNAKKKDRKSLSVSIGQEGEQDILIAYSIPCPIWKTSYRLVVNESEKILLQAMAIVDNVQEEDWTDVQVVLVSASPVSFIQPLYDPVQPKRPRIAAQGSQSAAPVLAERSKRQEVVSSGGYGGGMPMAPRAQAMSAEMADSWGAPAPVGVMREQASYSEMLSDAIDAGLDVESGQKGELFEYRINKPVSIPRNSSALIPIVQQNIEAERISLYNEAKNRAFPYAAIRFENDTGLTLEGGPVTVMELDIYAGEALLDTVKPKDTRYLLYAIDQSCPVIVREDQISKPHWRVRAHDGMIFADYKFCTSKSYEFENFSDKPKVLYLEHPFSDGWQLVSKPDPDEITQSFYRFRVELEPQSNKTIKVAEETEQSSQVWLMEPLSLDMATMQWLAAQNYVDRQFLEFLNQIMLMVDDLKRLQSEIAEQQLLLKQATEDQARARENLKTLGTNNEHYRKIVDTSEDQITECNKKIQELNRQMRVRIQEYKRFAAKQLMSELEAELST